MNYNRVRSASRITVNFQSQQDRIYKENQNNNVTFPSNDPDQQQQQQKVVQDGKRDQHLEEDLSKDRKAENSFTKYYFIFTAFIILQMIIFMGLAISFKFAMG
jgi:hypothetical protein